MKIQKNKKFGFGGSIDQAAILDFVDSGHRLIIAADVQSSDLIREIATECGADFDGDPSAIVIDHISYAGSENDGDHTLIASDNIIKANLILGNSNIEIPVRPFRHNEYERFIPAAYPYYGAAFSMMAGFFLFSFVHLYSK